MSSQHQPGELGLREEHTTDQAHVISPAEEATVCTVTLEKTSAGLGFSLEGGKGSLHGDKPLTINRIFKGRLLFFFFFLYILFSRDYASNTPKPRTPENLFGHGRFPHSLESRVDFCVQFCFCDLVPLFSPARTSLCVGYSPMTEPWAWISLTGPRLGRGK